MKTVQLIANRAHYYERDLQAEEPYEATVEHAAVLIRAGTSRPAPQTKPREYKRRDMVAEK